MAAYVFSLGARKIFWYQMFDTTGDQLRTYGLVTASFEKKQAYSYNDAINSYHP